MKKAKQNKPDKFKPTTWGEDAQRVQTARGLPPYDEMNVLYPRLHLWEWDGCVSESHMGILDEMRAMRQSEELKIEAIRQSSTTLNEIMNGIERIALAQEGLLEFALTQKAAKPRQPTKAIKILERIREQGDMGLTDDEGKAIFGDDFNYTPLRCYLVRQDQVVASHLHRRSRSGHRVQVWVAVEYAQKKRGGH
jgi:hypothetical protein